MKYEINENEFVWLQEHIGIVSLAALKNQIFSSDNILSVVQKNALSKCYSDYWFTSIDVQKDVEELQTFKVRQIKLVRDWLGTISQ